MRAGAGIEGAAIVVGVNNLVEIWSEAGWQAIEADTSDYTSLADEVARKRNASP